MFCLPVVISAGTHGEDKGAEEQVSEENRYDVGGVELVYFDCIVY